MRLWVKWQPIKCLKKEIDYAIYAQHCENRNIEGKNRWSWDRDRQRDRTNINVSSDNYFSLLFARDVAKCVYIDVKQHNTTSLPSKLKHRVWIWRYIRLIVALLNAPMDHSLGALCLRGCQSSQRKSQKQVIFIVYIWRLQVYHVCINLLLQQRDAEEFTADG